MARRYVKKKKKKKARLGCALSVFLLLLASLTLVIVLVSLSSRRKDGTPSAGGDALWDGGWYTDDLGRIDGERSLVKGMEAFEKKTGVRPYLTLLADVDPEELDMFAQDQYEALFSDGGHLLVVYDEWEDDVYYLSAQAGGQSGLSREDVTRILSCLEAAYGDPANKTFADAFGAGFRQGAREASVRAAGSGGVGLLIALGLFLLLLSVILILFLRRRVRDARRRDVFEDDLADEG